METLWQDVRYGTRMLLKAPSFSIVAIIALALGIGANTAIFSVVNAVLLRPLPYQESDRLLMIWGNFQKLKIERLTARPAEFEDYRAQHQLFEQVAAFDNQSFNLTGSAQAERITGLEVTANLLPMLGGELEQGRHIASEENQPEGGKVVILSYDFWQRHFGNDPHTVGQTLTLNDENYRVIGVMRANFQFPHSSFSFAQPAQVWVPLVYPAEQVAKREGSYYLNVIARLKPGINLSQARGEMQLLAQRFETQYRGYRGPNGEDGGWRITLAPLQDEAVGSSRRALLLLAGAVLLVLLIACANVANLLLVRAARRQKEFAVRMALGARRWRILRQLLIESLILAIVGGALGLLLATWGIHFLTALQTANLPRVREVSVDARVLVFTGLLTLVTSLLFGLLPAWRHSKLDLQSVLKENRPTILGRWRQNYSRNVLLVGEVALSLALLIGAGLLVKSFLRLQQTEPVVAVDRLLTVEINLPEARYAKPAQVAGFFQELVRRVEALPAVEAATLSTRRPLSGVTRNDPFAIEGRSLDPANISFAGWQVVGAKYFQALEIPLLQGRDLTAEDLQGAAPPVAVINQTMARRYWPRENPVGKRITLGMPRPENPWVTIIGVAQDVPQRLDLPPAPDWFLSRPSAPPRDEVLLVRIAGNPAGLGAAIRNAVAGIDPNQPVTNIQTMNDVVADTVAPRKFNMSLLTLFAGIALTLAGLGIYGVMAYSVAQRTHELGIRMALGAQKRDVMAIVIRDGMLLTLIGVTLGLGLALSLTRLMSALLFDVVPTDAITFVVVSAMFVLVALIACYIPARRAARVDPLLALRYE